MSHPPRTDRKTQIRRVLAALVAGRSPREIAAAEGVTVRRVQQVISAALKQREANPGSDFKLLQIARLEQALETIGAEIDAGDTRSIYAYLMALDRLCKLGEDEFHLADPCFRRSGAVDALEERFRRLETVRELIAARRTPGRNDEKQAPPAPPPPASL